MPYTIAYLVDDTLLLREKVKTDDPYVALRIARSRQPVLADFCNKQDPKHPSRHIGQSGIELRILRQSTDADSDC